tara:strand:- start:64 stop:696 length:633 start_codon:yes stop_codon:yes gene_type:complete
MDGSKRTFFSDYGGFDISSRNHTLGDCSFVGKNIFDERVLSDIEEYISRQQLVDAQCGTGNSYKNKNDQSITRSTKIHWMRSQDKCLVPIYHEISTKIRLINHNMWDYTYDGYEPFQYSEYDISDHFDWHIDQIKFTGPNIRKVSFSIGLSNEDEYEGGDLVLKQSDKDNHYKLGRGDIIVFPSWMLHKVTPITKGKRRVVVGWAQGSII